MKGMVTSLAETNGLGYVRVCSCGSINLNIGAVTLHIEPDTFLRAATMLQQAAVAFSRTQRDGAGESKSGTDILMPTTNLVN